VSLLLFVSYSGASGGAETVLLDSATALEGEVCIACPEGELARRARARGVRVFPLREHRLQRRGSIADRVLAPLRLAGHGREVRTLLAALDPDLLVCWGMRSGLACVGAAGTAGHTVLQHHDMLPGAAAGTLVRRMARRADLVVVPSRTVADDLDPARRIGERIRVVAPGVQAADFASDQAPVQPAEMLVLGALVEWKRPGLAIEALALARDRGVELHLRLVGAPITAEDPTPERLRAQARELGVAGAVEFAGHSSDPPADLARATCLLHCAPREPFGLAVLEAMAAGRPVVAPDAGGPAEIVDRSCAILYPPGNADAAAEAVASLVRDPARAIAMGAAGRERAQSAFSLQSARRRFKAAVAPLVRAPVPAGGPASELALVTVSHNSERELKALLRSVERWLPGAELIVVDTASSDHSVSVARAHPGTTVLALSENDGFGRACNRGIAEVSAHTTVLLNPDVELLDDSLALLADELHRSGRPERILAPLVLRPDGSREDSVHPVPSSAPDLVCAVLSPSLMPRALAVPLAPWRASRPRPVGWAVGCALAARTDTLRRLGPFDETIFLYGEDLELGLRAAEHGVETWFWPQARVLHHGAHSSRREFGGEPFELLAAARREVIGRRLGRSRAALDVAAQATTFASRIAVKRLLGRSVERERRQLRALRSARAA
jgi:GT2 family glycosyltransferase/glycosyltransferase involved in cell wall biosynthesis